MTDRIEILKRIFPRKVIERDRKKKHITQRTLSKMVEVPYQTINAIISGKRNLTTRLAINIEKALDYDESFFIDFKIADEEIDPICLKGNIWELITLEFVEKIEELKNNLQ